MGEASRAPHRSLGFIGVSSLPSTTTWATGGPSPRGCSRTTTQHLPRSTTKWFVRCWHRRVGSGGAARTGGSQLGAPCFGWVRRRRLLQEQLCGLERGCAGQGRTAGCLQSLLAPLGPPPIYPAMPSLSPLGLFPWGWGEAGALPAPLPSSLPHFLATAAAWPSTSFFPPGAWSWVGGRPAGVPPCVQPNPAGQEQPLQEGEA